MSTAARAMAVSRAGCVFIQLSLRDSHKSEKKFSFPTRSCGGLASSLSPHGSPFSNSLTFPSLAPLIQSTNNRIAPAAAASTTRPALPARRARQACPIASSAQASVGGFRRGLASPKSEYLLFVLCCFLCLRSLSIATRRLDSPSPLLEQLRRGDRAS